ncbi:hypothetical protein IMSAG049_00940 [Clostridiales bacterium]|nr:hypothetical protein IMSAG049_00940 [Clostridiales bacterium]
MKFGCCASLKLYDKVEGAGYDFIEIPGWELAEFDPAGFLQAEKLISAGSIPCLAVNAYAKTEPKMVGEGFEIEKIVSYAETIMERAARLGVKTVGIGAPGIRRLSPDYDRNRAWEQGKEFLKITCGIAEKYDITVLFEPVHKYLCDFGVYADEVYAMVDELKLKNLKMVLDYYNMKPMGTDLFDVEKYMKYALHLHTSGIGENYSRPQIAERDYDELVKIFESVLALGYDRTFSNESDNSCFDTQGAKALHIIKKAYAEADRRLRNSPAI